MTNTFSGRIAMRRKFPKELFLCCARWRSLVGCGGEASKSSKSAIVRCCRFAAIGGRDLGTKAIQFTATVTGDTSGVVWSVNGVASGNSTVGTIDSTGKFTAPLVTQKATATVAATSKGDPTKSASSTVTINAPPLSLRWPFSPQSVIIGAGQSRNLRRRSPELILA